MKHYETQYEKMTQAPVPELVVRLGIPTTISMMVTAIYNLADTFFVGQLGNSASAAVGVVFSYMAVIQAVGFMFGQGCGSNISRLLGAKQNDRASVFASSGIFGALGTGLVIFILVSIFKSDLIWLLGSTDTVFPYADDYLTFIAWAAPFTMGSFVLNNIMRFEGKANLSMIGLLAGAILNMALDPLLIFVFDMGIAGAAMATSISQTVSFFILLSMFARKKTDCRLSFSLVSRDIRDWGNIIGTGLPSLIRQSMGSISTMILNWQVKVFGDAAMAAMSIVTRVNMLIFSAGLGIGQGFQPVCGFNYGAKKYSRVRQAYDFTVRIAMALIAVISILCGIFAPSVISVFRNDPDVIDVGTLALRVQCISLLVMPIMVITNMTLQSTGQKLAATFTSMLRSGLYFIPVLLLLSYFFGLTGIQVAQAIADVMAVLTCIPIIMRFFAKMPQDEAVAENG